MKIRFKKENAFIPIHKTGTDKIMICDVIYKYNPFFCLLDIIITPKSDRVYKTPKMLKNMGFIIFVFLISVKLTIIDLALLKKIDAEKYIILPVMLPIVLNNNVADKSN